MTAEIVTWIDFTKKKDKWVERWPYARAIEQKKWTEETTSSVRKTVSDISEGRAERITTFDFERPNELWWKIWGDTFICDATDVIEEMLEDDERYHLDPKFQFDLARLMVYVKWFLKEIYFMTDIWEQIILNEYMTITDPEIKLMAIMYEYLLYWHRDDFEDSLLDEFEYQDLCDYKSRNDFARKISDMSLSLFRRDSKRREIKMLSEYWHELLLWLSSKEGTSWLIAASSFHAQFLLNKRAEQTLQDDFDYMF